MLELREMSFKKIVVLFLFSTLSYADGIMDKALFSIANPDSVIVREYSPKLSIKHDCILSGLETGDQKTRLAPKPLPHS